MAEPKYPHLKFLPILKWRKILTMMKMVVQEVRIKFQQANLDKAKEHQVSRKMMYALTRTHFLMKSQIHK